MALDAALLVASGHGTGSRQEVIVTSELEQARVKLDRGALARKHGAFQVVVVLCPTPLRGRSDQIAFTDLAD